MKDKRKYLYVLLCENENFYIGQTNDLVRRFRQHKEQGKEGSVWTSNHKPIKIVQYWKIADYSQDDAINFENKLTLEYINEYGWQKVRGGMYIYFNEDHHLRLLKKYNDIVDDKFIPKTTYEKIQNFVKIKFKISKCNPEKKQAYIYVLKLKNNKIYISRSSNVTKDIKRHFYTSKTKWTTKYPPIDLLELIEDSDKGLGHSRPHQNEIVFKYMALYGWKNVRGGDFVITNNIVIRKNLEKKNPELLKISDLKN